MKLHLMLILNLSFNQEWTEYLSFSSEIYGLPFLHITIKVLVYESIIPVNTFSFWPRTYIWDKYVGS